MNNEVAGFSKLSKEEKINWIANHYFSTPNEAVALLKSYWNADEKIQKLHEEFIENTISNFYRCGCELTRTASFSNSTVSIH